MGFLKACSFLLVLVLAVRSIFLFFTAWSITSYRSINTIPRLRDKQHAIDILGVIYRFIMILFWCYITLFLKNIYLNTIPGTFFGFIPFIIILFFMIYHMIGYYLDNKYDIETFYYDLVEYKKKEKKVTSDNDYEVEFKQTYNKYNIQKKFVFLYVIILLFIIIWF
jgi:hypothetical protein